MKKIFTSIAASLLCAFASSAAITVTMDGVAIEDGGTIKFTADNFEKRGIRFIAEKDIVITADGAPVDVTLMSDVTTGFGFCIDVCYSPMDNGAGQNVVNLKLDDKATTVSIHKEYVMVSELPKDKCWMSVQLSQGNDDFAFLIEVDTESAGINGIGAGSGATFSHNVLSYNLAAPSQLAVYSITGTSVLNRTLSGNGTVDFSVLPKGIYIYTLAGKATRVLVK